MPAPSLSSIGAERARERPEAPALIFRGRSVGYGQLDDAVGRAAAALRRGGVGHGDRVAFLGGNVPEFVYALYGAWRVGAVAVALHGLLTAGGAGVLLAGAGATALVAGAGM